MHIETKVALALGLIDGTLGSPREYNAEDYKRRLEMAGYLLRGVKYTPEIISADMQRQGFLDGKPENIRAKQVRDAFDSLYKIYDFQGESGTEELLYRLEEAVNISLNEAKRNHEEECSFTDCVPLLARTLDAVIIESRKNIVVEQAKSLAGVQ